MFCVKRSGKTGVIGSTPVYLNVYDITTGVNAFVYWLGLGVFHSGVQVHGVEYSFGPDEYSKTGIDTGEPTKFNDFVLRKSILIGWTNMSKKDVRKMMRDISDKYSGNSYDLITKNCNHFCNDVCIKLTGNCIPKWVNRLARIGNRLGGCVAPPNTKVRHHTAVDETVCDPAEKMQRCSLNRHNSSSRSSSSPSTRPGRG